MAAVESVDCDCCGFRLKDYSSNCDLVISTLARCEDLGKTVSQLLHDTRDLKSQLENLKLRDAEKSAQLEELKSRETEINQENERLMDLKMRYENEFMKKDVIINKLKSRNRSIQINQASQTVNDALPILGERRKSSGELNQVHKKFKTSLSLDAGAGTSTVTVENTSFTDGRNSDRSSLSREGLDRSSPLNSCDAESSSSSIASSYTAATSSTESLDDSSVEGQNINKAINKMKDEYLNTETDNELVNESSEASTGLENAGNEESTCVAPDIHHQFLPRQAQILKQLDEILWSASETADLMVKFANNNMYEMFTSFINYYRDTSGNFSGPFNSYSELKCAVMRPFLELENAINSMSMNVNCVTYDSNQNMAMKTSVKKLLCKLRERIDDSF